MHIQRSGTTEMNTRKSELLLSGLAFVAAAVPILMLVLGGMAAMISMGMSVSDVKNKPPDPAMQQPMMKAMHSFMTSYIPFAMLPALIILIAIWTYASRHYPSLANRIGAGLAAGVIGTIIGLEPVRLIGVKLGAFPGDMPSMIGQMITGHMMPDATARIAGYVYHILLNGGTFGIMYAVLFGKARWAWGIAWGLFFEAGMMLLPPVPMMAGPFGIYGFWPGLFVASFLAHVAFGLILGLLAHNWIRDRGTIFGLLIETPVRPEAPLRRTA
jgi:hypothetical protein